MAKKTNGVLSDEQVKMLRELDPDPSTVHVMVRDSVREIFDDALKDHAHFEDALLAVYAAGMAKVASAKPKRRRKAKAPEAEA